MTLLKNSWFAITWTIHGIFSGCGNTWHLFRLRKYETENFEGVVNADAVKPYTRDFGTHAPVIKFPDCLENVQVLNHLAADLEQRRNAISREIGYHRTIFKPLLSVKEITHE
jgi:hypothetical protein